MNIREETPRFLLLVREWIRAGTEAAYDENERRLATASATLGCPHPYLALVAASNSREVWWLNAFASAEERDGLNDAYARNEPLMSALVPLGKRKEDFREALTTTALSHRADAGPALTFVGARFLIVRATRDPRVSPGSSFESTDGEWFAMASAPTRAAADDIAMHFGSGAMILAIQPTWSFPAERWVQADADFWDSSPAAQTRRNTSITTDRLTLRAPRSDDAASLVALMTPDISQWLATWPPHVDVDEARRRINEAQHDVQSGRAMHWVIEHREHAQVLGWIRIARIESDASRGELGFWLGASFHGHGYATEAARAALRAGCECLNLQTIEGGAQLANEASQRVMRSVGMVRSDEREVWVPARRRHELCVFYEIDRAHIVGGGHGHN